MIELKFTECENLKSTDEYGYADYMLCLKHKTHGGWLYGNLCPLGEIGVYPSAVAQGLFAEETVRITPRSDGKLSVFRLDDYIERLDSQAKAMGLPSVDKELTAYGVKQLLSLCRPFASNGAVYAQMTLMSLETDPDIYPAREAVLTVTLKKEPPRSMNTLTACTSSECIMAHPHKFGAPFAYSVRAGRKEAKSRGYDNVLWLDSVYGRYVDALAGMDVFFRFGDSVVYAGGGITADSVRALMRDWHIDVASPRISTDQIIKEYEQGTLMEAFAVGTKNTVIPVTRLDIGGTVLELPRAKLAKKLYDALYGIESGDYPDGFGWVSVV